MSSAKSPDWQMCRLRRETVAGLRALVAGFERAREAGTPGFIHEPGEQGWSIDQIVTVILEREESHRRRSRSKLRKRSGKRTPRSSGQGVSTPTAGSEGGG
jgi:hypothetical protein